MCELFPVSSLSVFKLLLNSHQIPCNIYFFKPLNFLSVLANLTLGFLVVEIHFAGENLQFQRAHSFTCPVCGVTGLSLPRIREHATAEHNRTHQEVVGRLCVASLDIDHCCTRVFLLHGWTTMCQVSVILTVCNSFTKSGSQHVVWD